MVRIGIKHDTRGWLSISACTANLLIIVQQRMRHAVVDHKSDIYTKMSKLDELVMNIVSNS
jgi:hypothetical protein